jgi:opacity protein-like surface antigen
MMRYLLAGAALAALASPAAAPDHSAYVGLEIGPMFAQNSTGSAGGERLFEIDYKLGVDGDLIAGYDFGLIRAEVEASHKWAKHSGYDIDGDGSVDGHGHTSGFTDMGNILLDFGKNDTVNFYVGGGAGLAWLNERSIVRASGGGEPIIFESHIKSKGHFAWQGIAGVRAPVFRYFDVGLKYRYFNAGHFSDNGQRGEFRSHSVLASLIYNFGPERVAAPPPPPPPPPPPLPPPATQTCPDGSVVLATDACPMPPPPPPPPPPSPERGG